MIQENDNKQAASQSGQTAENQPVSQPDDRHQDDDQASYPGQLDHVEGRMHNGELGAGLKKEDQD